MGAQHSCPNEFVGGLCVAKKKIRPTFALKIHVVVGSFSSVRFPTHMASMKLEILYAALFVIFAR